MGALGVVLGWVGWLLEGQGAAAGRAAGGGAGEAALVAMVVVLGRCCWGAAT